VERIAFLVNKKQRNNPLSVMDLMQAIRIVPAHVFEPLIEKLGSKDEVKKLPMDKDPVVSGPYALRSADPNKIILERRDDYWGNAALHEGKLPAPKYIVHPIYKNNEHNTIAMRSGNLDASQSYIPRINRKAGAGVHTWLDNPPYFLPGAMPMLIINTMKEPLNDKRFRRALATAIDYMALRKFAVSDYTDQIKPGLIMPTALEGKYINDEDLAKYWRQAHHHRRKGTRRDGEADAFRSGLQVCLEQRRNARPHGKCQGRKDSDDVHHEPERLDRLGSYGDHRCRRYAQGWYRYS
jgi:peptide/nickel transport system substrate-binding protein